MSVRLYDLTTCTCSISAVEPLHEAMGHYLSVYEASRLSRPDVVVAVGSDADAVAAVLLSLARMPPTALRRSHPEQRYQVWTTNGQEVLLPDRAPDHVISTTGNHITVTAEHLGMAATIGVRVIRQLIMRGGEARGGRAVHAGAVDIDGEGVLVGGHPGAGKTTMLTLLVEHHGARAVANDRAVLIPIDNQAWRAVGVPLAWRFTPEGAGGSPRLASALACQQRSRGRDLVDGKIELTPLEVGQLLDRPAVGAVHITRVVILVRSSHARPLTPDAAFVRRHLDFGATDFFADDWLNMRPQLARYESTSRDEGDAWWAKLATSVPVQVLSLTEPAELPQVAAAVVGARQ